MLQVTSKFDLGAIVVDQTRTLVDSSTRRVVVGDVVTLFGLPLAIGGLSLWLGWTMGGVGELLGGMAILTGLLFGLVVWTFQLRMTAGANPAQQSSVTSFLDELFANVLYSVLVGILTVALIVAETSFQVDPSGVADPRAGQWWTAVLLVVISHFLLTLAMCLKRVRAAYHKMIP